mmetsp:Transcript_66359/g.188430  ORF Transcript_66359/g.188430 Transcript_66359/m.188430 type:complete len:427 (+) Transcript_66359:793-2073(+)
MERVSTARMTSAVRATTPRAGAVSGQKGPMAQVSRAARGRPTLPARAARASSVASATLAGARATLAGRVTLAGSATSVARVSLVARASSAARATLVARALETWMTWVGRVTLAAKATSALKATLVVRATFVAKAISAKAISMARVTLARVTLAEWEVSDTWAARATLASRVTLGGAKATLGKAILARATSGWGRGQAASGVAMTPEIAAAFATETVAATVAVLVIAVTRIVTWTATTTGIGSLTAGIAGVPAIVTGQETAGGPPRPSSLGVCPSARKRRTCAMSSSASASESHRYGLRWTATLAVPRALPSSTSPIPSRRIRQSGPSTAWRSRAAASPSRSRASPASGRAAASSTTTSARAGAPSGAAEADLSGAPAPRVATALASWACRRRRWVAPLQWAATATLRARASLATLASVGRATMATA